MWYVEASSLTVKAHLGIFQTMLLPWHKTSYPKHDIKLLTTINMDNNEIYAGAFAVIATFITAVFCTLSILKFLYS